MANPRLQVDVIANLKKFNESIDKLAPKLNAVGEKLQSVGKRATLGLTVPLGLAGAKAIQMASDINESMNKVDVAFKSSSDLVKAFSEDTLKSFGISQGEALESAALFGDMATSMGLSTSEASRMSTQLVGLAGDLASFKNIQVDVARTALASIFTGETESLKKLGVVMTQVNLEEFARSQGIDKSIKAMTQAEQVQLRYQFIMAKTVNAQGDFARTSEGSANQMRIFTEGVKQLTTDLGQVLLPVFTKIITKINEVIQSFNDTSKEFKFFTVAIGIAVTAVGPLLFVFGKLISVLAIAKLRFKQLNVQILKTYAIVFAKVIAIVAIIASLAGAFIYVKKNAEEFSKMFTNIWNGVKGMLLNKIRDMSFAMSKFFEKIGLDGLSDSFGRFSKDVQSSIDEIPKPEDTNFMSLKEFLGELKGDFTNLTESIKNGTKSLLGFEEEASKLSKAGLGQATTVRTGLDVGKQWFLDRKVTQTAVENIKLIDDQVRTFSNFLAGQAQTSIVTFAESMTDLFTGDIGKDTFFSNLLLAVADFASEFGKLAIAIGLSAKTLKESLFTNPAAAIAAGIALVVAGKALKSRVSSMGQGMKEGGIVPAGFPNDTYPALLTSGEAVIPKPDRLPSFNNSMTLDGEFRVRGTDLVLTLAEANYTLGR